ncbi:MAG: hypothetical protein HY040_03215, partial [Planctomycetes bacterium]|nr:hypothetical protein [Planctomycetota bacterium]
LNEADKLDQSAQFDFDVPAKERDRIEKLLIGLGDVFARSTKQADPKETSTERKVGYQILLKSVASIKPRETFVQAAVSADVPAAFRKLQDAVIQAKGQVRKSDLDQRDERKPLAELEFDVPADGRETIDKLLVDVAEVFSRTTNRVAANEVATARKVGYRLSIRSVAGMPPRDTVIFAIQVREVDQAAARLKEMVKAKGGTVVHAPIKQDPSGQITAVLLFDVPLSAKDELAVRFKGIGTVHQYSEKPNYDAPETKLSTAQLNVVLADSAPIVPSDEGFWPQVRTSLGYSFRLLIWSLMFIVLGVMVVLPWALILWVAMKLTKRWRTKTQVTTP